MQLHRSINSNKNVLKQHKNVLYNNNNKNNIYFIKYNILHIYIVVNTIQNILKNNYIFIKNV